VKRLILIKQGSQKPLSAIDKQLVVFLAVFGFSLTFISQVFWVVVFGSVFLLMIYSLHVLSAFYVDKKKFYMSMVLLHALVLALFWGAGSEFYNRNGLVIVITGFFVGYHASIVKMHPTLAWLPFWLFLTYFALCWVLGIDSNAVLPRNSRNYISIILLGLLGSAILLSKQEKPSLHTYLAVTAVLIFSVWAEGRSGIISSFFLLFMVVGASAINLKIRFKKLILFLSLVVLIVFFAFLYYLGVFERLSQRGFSDFSRVRIISEYFSGISILELFMGRNYLSIPSLGYYGHNLHNSFLSAWALGGFLYLSFMIYSLLAISSRFYTFPMLSVSVVPLSVRAITDTQVFFGKYDYVLIAAIFLYFSKLKCFRNQ
jgi:uncharacterized membrane protein